MEAGGVDTEQGAGCGGGQGTIDSPKRPVFLIGYDLYRNH